MQKNERTKIHLNPELFPKTKKQPQKTFKLAEPTSFAAPDHQEHPCEEKPSVAQKTERELGECHMSYPLFKHDRV